MLQSAKELYKTVSKNLEQRKKDREEQAVDNTQSFREKCLKAIDKMAESGNLDTEVALRDGDHDGLHAVVEELRDSGYRHCFIEVQNTEGKVVAHRLRISLKHLSA